MIATPFDLPQLRNTQKTRDLSTCDTPGRWFEVMTDPNEYLLELARRTGVTLAVNPRETALKDVQMKLGLHEEPATILSGHSGKSILNRK